MTARSTPRYLDAEQGHTCGNCDKCYTDNPYNPAQFGLCETHDRTVNIRRITTCGDWKERQTA